MSRTRHHRGARDRKVDRSCLNHGGCPWCEANRLFADKKRREGAQDKIKETKTDG